MLVEEKIIGKDLAFIAYDKGFNCYGWSAFMYESKWHEEDDSYELEGFDFRIPDKYWDARLKFCPQSLVQKWFREVHNIHIEIDLASYNPYIYQFSIYKDCQYHSDREFYEVFEDCLESALMLCFSLI